jgi:hypothetical protein
LRVQRSTVAGHVVLWRENYRPAIFDFCNNIGQMQTSTHDWFGGVRLIRSHRYEMLFLADLASSIDQSFLRSLDALEIAP